MKKVILSITTIMFFVAAIFINFSNGSKGKLLLFGQAKATVVQHYVIIAELCPDGVNLKLTCGSGSNNCVPRDCPTGY